MKRQPIHTLDITGANNGDIPTVDTASGRLKYKAAAAASGGLTIQDENGNVATGVTQLDFQGAGVTATAGTGEVVITIPGGAGGATGRVLLKKITLAAAAASIDFASADIPTSGYDHLELMVIGRSAAALVGDAVNLAVNGDTTAANYKQQRLYGASGAAGAVTTATRRVGYVDAGSDPVNGAGVTTLRIVDYLGSWHKMILAQGYKLGDPVIDHLTNRWANTAPVTSLSLTCGSGNWVAGSKAWLYALT